MKRFVIVLLLAVSLFSLSSCFVLNKNVCYYAYFRDSAFVLIYSATKNTLYEINIPPEAISLWGRSQNIVSVPDAIRSFADMKEDGFMLGTSQTLEAIREILNAMSSSENPTAEDRLQVLTERAADFSSPALLSKMNSLCGTDMTSLVNALKRTEAKSVLLDASSVVSSSNAAFAQKYFKDYLTQVISK